jgi:hypothetical protein
MNFALLACVLVLNVPLLLLIGRVLFGNWRGFFDACDSLFVLDLSSAMWGDEREARPGKFVMLVFLVFAILSTMVEYQLLKTYWWP